MSVAVDDFEDEDFDDEEEDELPMSVIDKAEKSFKWVLEAPDDEFCEDEWNLGAGLASDGIKLVRLLRKIEKIVKEVKEEKDPELLAVAMEEIKQLF